jgi:hypothetical protein
MTWAKLSKIVGWDQRETIYPDKEIVDKLEESIREGSTSAMIIALSYHRFLKSPITDEEMEVINGINRLIPMIRDILES